MSPARRCSRRAGLVGTVERYPPCQAGQRAGAQAYLQPMPGPYGALQLQGPSTGPLQRGGPGHDRTASLWLVHSRTAWNAGYWPPLLQPQPARQRHHMASCHLITGTPPRLLVSRLYPRRHFLRPSTGHHWTSLFLLDTGVWRRRCYPGPTLRYGAARCGSERTQLTITYVSATATLPLVSGIPPWAITDPGAGGGGQVRKSRCSASGSGREDPRRLAGGRGDT